MLFLLGVSLSFAFLLQVWLKTDAFYEYASVFSIFYLGDYSKLKKDGYIGSYIDFLIEYHNCFFVKLISCPICLSFWLNLSIYAIPGLIFGNLEFAMTAFPSMYLTLLAFNLLNKNE